MFRLVAASIFFVAVTAAPCDPVPTTVAPCQQVMTITTPPCAVAPTTTVSPCGSTGKWTQSDHQRIHEDTIAKMNPTGTNTSTTTTTPAPFFSIEEDRCQNGWTRFKESCYFTERDAKKSLKDAEKKCREINSTLFVPNTMDEFTTIFENAPFNTWTWLGLRNEDDASEPHWHVADVLNYTVLPWLNSKPYQHGTNGWTTASECAAHWNPATNFGKYVFWYPCDYAFHFVCERNSTLATNLDHLF